MSILLPGWRFFLFLCRHGKIKSNVLYFTAKDISLRVSGDSNTRNIYTQKTRCRMKAN